MRKCRLSGFSLAELLVALAILGLITTFTIQKVLTAQQNSKRIAIFKETLATLAQITHEASRDENINHVSVERNYFSRRLNYIKVCTADPTAEGCWSSDAGGGPGNGYAYLLSNGAAISSINGLGGDQSESLNIDWNGPDPPNIQGDDILYLTACLGQQSCSGSMLGTGPVGPGSIGPRTNTSATAYNQIFSQ